MVMAKVIGVGGIFFKSKDTARLVEWYRDVLGMPVQDWGGILLMPETMANHPGAATVFSPFKHDTDYFVPSTKEFMINLAVDDLDGVLVGQVVAALDGVEGVPLPVVFLHVGQRGAHAALRRTGVRPGGVQLGQHGGAHPRPGLDGRAHSCAARADDDDVIAMFLNHGSLTRYSRRT